MNKHEVLRRIERKMDEDDNFARDIANAVEAENDYWLMELIGNIIGVVIEIASDIWDWISDFFS